MFETAELGRTLSKREYVKREPTLREQLLEAQADLRTAGIPVLILIGGVEGAGKGETVNLLHEWMDPRYLLATGFGDPTDEERERPEFWRFWRALPPKGRIGIFFGSWYTRPIVERAQRTIDNTVMDAQLARIVTLERELIDDGMLIIKLWFHISKGAQRKRLRALEKNPRTRWRVTKEDWKLFEKYDRYRRVSERAIRATSTGEAPWVLVEGEDERWRSVFVAEHLLEQLTRAIRARSEAKAVKAVKATLAAADGKGHANGNGNGNGDGTLALKPITTRHSRYTLLDTLDLTKTLDPVEYKRELERYQGTFNQLYRQMRAQGRSLLALFEGWDAAGKGGCIRRITAAMDARHYQVIPIAAPNEEERSHHYLWRFWRHLPREGRVTIYDRSWYGRVLVERVEEFARQDEWERAYHEIVDFEEQLHDRGVVVTKFWLHLDKAEQLRRFRERQRTGFKHYKITEEDFRNRKRWDDYELAANDMIERTSTEFAPWTLVEANDKPWARVKVLKTVCEAIEKVV